MNVHFLKNKTFFFDFSELRAQIQNFCEPVCDKSAKLDRSFFDKMLKTERKKNQKIPQTQTSALAQNQFSQ